MKYSSFNRIRDVLLFCALLFLVKNAFERTTSFINAHKKSIVHELDRDFIEQIYIAQRQAHLLKEQYEHTKEVADELDAIQNELAIIEEKYKTNSPGVMLLGPIGSAAIVAKEEKLKNKLLNQVNAINRIAHVIHEKEHEFQPAPTITIALEKNKKLLHNTAA